MKTRPFGCVRGGKLLVLVAGLAPSLTARAQSETSSATTADQREESTVFDKANVDRIEEITILGSRRAQPRTAVNSPVPVDVLRGQDLMAQGNTDIVDTLTSVVPSLNASREPISDAATLIRPVNLRALPADHTLVLVNGKRRHRGAVVGEFVSGVNRGAQGVDVYPLFGFGLRQVEVLRDGAAAQYGSDAIAGVINYSLLADPNIRQIGLQFSQAYEGDGTTLEANGAFGLPLGEDGFATMAFQVRDQNATSRGVQDGGASALGEAGFPVEDPVVVWGQPNVRDDYKFIVNSAIPTSGTSEVYAFGTYSRRNVDGSFFYRDPSGRAGVFVDPDTGNFLFADQTGEGGCPVGLLPTDSFADAQAFINSAPTNCFSFFNDFPGGFTPRFGGTVEDISVFAGFRGKVFDETFTYDLSVGFGDNNIDYTISNTVNASLGPASPFSFDLGSQNQSEVVANADFTYGWDIGLASPLNIAFGFQYQNEEFEIAPGELASFQAGPFASQGFSVGANGFPGFSDRVAGIFQRDSYGLYLDLEADITDQLILSGAVRYEDFSDFGNTFNGKASALFRVFPALAVRGSVSTGFRAPTLGQSNLQRASTSFQDGQLVEALVISSTDPIAEFFGGGQLDAEDSRNISVGLTVSWGALNLTVDYFNIDVNGRIALTSTALTPEDQAALTDLGVANAGGLSQVQFFVNDFDTNTQGVDIVANYPISWPAGDTNIVLAFNWNDTRVSNRGATINDGREREIEEALPEFRTTATLTHRFDTLDGLIRINHYSDAFEALFNDEGLPVVTSSLVLVDLELGWRFYEKFRLAVGAKNVFDTFPDEWEIPDGNGGTSTGRTPGFLGAIYPLNHPAGFNGGSYYVRITSEF